MLAINLSHPSTFWGLGTSCEQNIQNLALKQVELKRLYLVHKTPIFMTHCLGEGHLLLHQGPTSLIGYEYQIQNFTFIRQPSSLIYSLCCFIKLHAH